MGKIQIVFFFSLAGLFLQACYTPAEGCLDIEATNYDVAADDPCEDCCTYPSLQFRFNHELVYPDTTLRLRYDSTYPVPGDPSQRFRLQRVQFYISGINFGSVGGNKGISQKVQLRMPDGTGDTTLQSVTDDFLVVDRDILGGRNLGDFRTNETLTSLNFSVGLSEEIRSADPRVLPTSHPLGLQADSLNWDPATGLIGFQLVLQPDTLSADLIEVALEQPIPIPLSLTPALQVERGFDLEVVMSIDYLSLLEEIDWQNVTAAGLESSIVSQLPNAFYFLELNFN
jgi:hypothetical protein